MMILPLVCPTCSAPLRQHAASQGFHCANKHHFDKHANGYWPLLVSNKTKMTSDSRQQMRARHFLLEQGMFEPLITALNQLMTKWINEQAGESEDGLNHVNYQCEDGYFLRKMVELVVNVKPDLAINHWGITDAENAIFTAAKSDTQANLLLSGLRCLPFADKSIDLVTLLDAPLKGKECTRILKDDGRIIILQTNVRHLWQIKEQVYREASQKPQPLNIPNNVEIVDEVNVSFTQPVTGLQALTLLDMATFGWRANPSIRDQVSKTAIETLEFDWQLVVLKKKIT